MRRVFILMFALLFAPALFGASQKAHARNAAIQDGQDERRVLRVPDSGKRRRRTGYDRPRGRGIRGAFAKAGRGAGRGGKRFGKNIAKGRPIRAGKELGKGMGTFGKYTGKGVARTTKRVFKP